MHAGEEAALVLIPLAIVLYLDYRQRRKLKRGAESTGASQPSQKAPEPDRPAD